MKKLSIIIPVYNVEQYVEKCLRSCAEQDLPPDEYEIIVINDGTPDKSLEIVESVAKDYSNISIYSQENRGLSAARNKGLSLAKGEYVWFVDSDDWIGDNCLKEMTDTLCKNNLDGLGIMGTRFMPDGTIYKFPPYQCVDNIMSGKEVLRSLPINVAAVKTVYRRMFLEENNLTFAIGIFHEDVEFTPRAYYFINRMLYKNYYNYCNRLNENSITQTPNPKRALDLIDVAIGLTDFRNKTVAKDLWGKYNTIASNAINSALNLSLELDKKNQKLISKKLNDNSELFKLLINSQVFKYKVEGVLFKLFPNNSIQIFKLMQKFNPR